LAFLAAAAIAPLFPALLSDSALRMIGITPHSAAPVFVDAWLRGFAAILVLTPAILMCCSGQLAEWVGIHDEGEPPHPISGRNVLEVAVETAVWGAVLWMTVAFKARYGLNITYLTFLPPLAFTLLRGMRMATLALAANGILATTLWSQLHWAGALPINDLRLLIAIYSTTVLVMAAVVDERKRVSGQVEDLRLEEAVLRKSEAHFRTLANSAPVMVWLSGIDRLCAFVNEPWLKFTGRTLAEELGEGWAAGVHPDDRDRCLTAYASSFDARRSFEMQYRLRRADGEYRWVLDKGTPLYRDGEFAGYIGSCIDITELKRVDEALRESEERFRKVFEEGPLGLALVGKDYRFVKVNAALCQMVGYPEASLVQMTFADLTHPDDLQADVVLAELLFRREVPFYTLRKRYVKKNGEIIWISLTASIVHDGEGEPTYGLAMIKDITEIQRAEDALRESEHRLVSIYNTVEDVIFHLAVEPEGQFRYISINAAFLRVTGLSQENVVGKTVNEVIPEPSLTLVLGKYRQAIKESTVVHWEETSDYPAGRVTGEVSVAPVMDKTGTCTHLVGSVHDITEVKRAQDIEDRLKSDLAASRDEIRALAASLMRAQEDERRRISRELHDHICHQLGSLARDIGRLAVGPLPPPKNVQAQLETIRARVVKTSQEAHDIAYQMHTAVLDDLGLVASLKDLCSQFSGHHPHIALDFEDSGPPASIPREVASCLYRVAEESLQNIAMHSGAKCASVRLNFKTGAVVLTIQDDGAGFDPKAVKGYGGLGLISMKERAYLVNGTLTIAAEFGHGTQITLEVPLPLEQPEKRPRVVLADDHPLVLEEIRSVLARNCEIVETAADGRALVEAALRSKPDLIVMDITMPLLNGIDAAVQIKKSLPEMKLLFVTMHASTAYLKAAFEAGGTGYVLKSGLRDELPGAVQSVLGGRVYVSHCLSTEYPERLQDHPSRASRSSSQRTRTRDGKSDR
jgi:PAS domain S-box-containing protein